METKPHLRIQQQPLRDQHSLLQVSAPALNISVLGHSRPCWIRQFPQAEIQLISSDFHSGLAVRDNRRALSDYFVRFHKMAQPFMNLA